jgi:hypothetical protein
MASDHEIDLTWTNNADNADAVDVYRSANGGAWTPIGYLDPTTSTLADTGLSPTSTYAYEIQDQAYNSDTDEVDYTSFSTSGQITIPFAAPTGLTASAVSGSEVDLTWQNNADNADSVLVQRSSDGGSTWTTVDTVGAGTTTYADTGLGAGNYAYQVVAQAYNGDTGDEAYAPSNQASASVGGSDNIGLTGTQLYLSEADSVGVTYTDSSGNPVPGTHVLTVEDYDANTIQPASNTVTVVDGVGTLDVTGIEPGNTATPLVLADANGNQGQVGLNVAAPVLSLAANQNSQVWVYEGGTATVTVQLMTKAFGGQPVSGWTVTATADANNSVKGGTATTDANGNATVTLTGSKKTAANTTATVPIQASDPKGATSNVVNANLTVVQPVLTITSITNAAGAASTTLS